MYAIASAGISGVLSQSTALSSPGGKAGTSPGTLLAPPAGPSSGAAAGQVSEKIYLLYYLMNF